LPLFERGDGETEPQRDALAAAAGERLGVAVRLDAQPGKPVKHVFTHRVWHLLPWSARSTRAVRLDGRQLAWFGPDSQPEGGVPTLTRKLLRAMETNVSEQ
jgi:A/G-specific adenine glycosylase